METCFEQCWEVKDVDVDSCDGMEFHPTDTHTDRAVSLAIYSSSGRFMHESTSR